jgi:predicted dehydrogenase
MSRLSRRRFLGASVGAFASLNAITAAGAADSPNERVRIAVMGLRSRGNALMKGFAKMENCDIPYLCEVDEAMLATPIKDLEQAKRGPAKVEKDIRRLVEQKDFDALVIAAPDHWHAPATVWACQNGKHVYVEKPVSHNLLEGQKMVKAAIAHKRVVTYGCQRRSAPHVQSAVEFVRSGKLGKVPFARTWIAGDRKTIGKKADLDSPPKGVDYDLWLGPAAARPFNSNRFHYNWHWFWEYGTGELGNNGIHALDIVRWGLGLDYPRKITCGGGKFFYDDDQETPDTQIATFDFANCSVVWEHRIWSKTGLQGEPWGVIFYGEKGTLVFDKNGWHVEQGVEASAKPEGNMDEQHKRNFLDAIRSGKALNAPIEEGHRTTLLCHLGNIAFRTGRALKFDDKNERCFDDAGANALLGRTYRKGFELG